MTAGERRQSWIAARVAALTALVVVGQPLGGVVQVVVSFVTGLAVLMLTDPV